MKTFEEIADEFFMPTIVFDLRKKLKRVVQQSFEAIELKEIPPNTYFRNRNLKYFDAIFSFGYNQAFANIKESQDKFLKGGK